MGTVEVIGYIQEVWNEVYTMENVSSSVDMNDSADINKGARSNSNIRRKGCGCRTTLCRCDGVYAVWHIKHIGVCCLYE